MAANEMIAEHGPFTVKDYHDPPPSPLLGTVELRKWSFYRALIAEFVATLLFFYMSVLTVIGYKRQTAASPNPCAGIGILGIAWAFGGMIFVLIYCTTSISRGHINPAVTFGPFIRAAIAAFYPKFIIRAGAVKAFSSLRINP